MSDMEFTCRPLAFDDAAEFARVCTAISRCAGPGDLHRADDELARWQEPRFDLEQSSLGIFGRDGDLAAFAILWATAEAPVHRWLSWGVNPAYHAHGLSERLFGWVDDQMPHVLSRCPAHARVSIRAGTVAGYKFGEDALSAAGYQPIRAFYDMRIEMTQKPKATDLPAGFVIKPYVHAADLPTLVQVVRDSFEDHFGHVERSFEHDLEEFRHWIDNLRTFDPALVQMAYDAATGEIAGCLLGLTEEPHHADIGYIDVVGVRREFRRRGLASALLRRSFAQYWDRGKRVVNLGVDADSLTNAVALYERVGMRVHQEYPLYDKLIRDGVELERADMDEAQPA